MDATIGHIPVPGLAEVSGTLARIRGRSPSLASCAVDHVSVCVLVANLPCYTDRIRAALRGATCSQHLIGDEDSGMWIADLEDRQAGVHLVLAAPAGPRGQVAEFLAVTGGEGLQHLAFAVPSLEQAMTRLDQEGIAFVGGREGFPGTILEVHEGEDTLRQAFTAPLWGGFFVELVERRGIRGLRPANMQALYAINEPAAGDDTAPRWALASGRP